MNKEVTWNHTVPCSVQRQITRLTTFCLNTFRSSTHLIHKYCILFYFVSAGCSVEGVCKVEGSYWHDGCTVYTCVREGNRTVDKPLGNGNKTIS